MARGKRGKGKKGSNGSAGQQGQIPYMPPTGDNKRAKAISDAVEEHCRLQKAEDDLIEKHIGPIRKKKNQLKAQLKADYGIPTAAFNARAMLRRVELTGDDEVVLATQECFDALPVGDTLDLVKIAERVTAKATEKAKKASTAKTQEAEL